MVHAGMLASAQWFFTRIVSQIFHFIAEESQSKTRPISSFIITGHSLGAGTAAVLTMMIADHIDELRQISGNPDFQVHCYSYAPVASVSLDLSEKYKEYIDSFVCQDDLVGRLSYGTATCAKELIMDAMIAVDGLGGTSKVNADAKARKACFRIIQARRQEIIQPGEPRYPLLYVPGQVFQFRRRTESTTESRSSTTTGRPRAASTLSKAKRAKPSASTLNIPGSTSEPFLPGAVDEELPIPDVAPGSFSLHKGSPMLSEEVLISKTCLEDHMLVTYLNAFQDVKQDCMRELHRKKDRTSDDVPSIQVETPDGRRKDI